MGYNYRRRRYNYRRRRYNYRRRRFVSWNDQVSSIKVSGRSGTQCHNVRYGKRVRHAYTKCRWVSTRHPHKERQAKARARRAVGRKRRKTKHKKLHHGCSPVKKGSVHCGQKFGTKCINSNTPLKSLREAWKQGGQVKGCTRIMHWGKDGKYYLRSAKDKVIRGAHSTNHYQDYLPHKYRCNRL